MNLCGDRTIRIVHPLFQMEDTGSNPSSPLYFNICEINVKLACKLNSLWHSRLPKIDWSNVVRNTCYVCYAAEYKNIFFAVAIWSSPIAQNRMINGKNILELRRFAISPEAPKNTASRMLKIMRIFIKKRFPNIVKLISYQDTDVHKGIIYKSSGWINSNKIKGISWSTENRKRNKDQTIADKIRWELYLRNSTDVTN